MSLKIYVYFILFIGLIFYGCSNDSMPEQHEQYLLNNGWEIKKFREAHTYQLNIPDELLSNYEASGITFLKDYLGIEVTQFTYELKEKDKEGTNLQAIVFEIDESVIGGYGVLPNWTPGIFDLEDKTYLIEQEMMKSD